MFEPMNFVENLKYLGQGMLGIMVVMGVIIITTLILNSATSRKKKSKDE